MPIYFRLLVGCSFLLAALAAPVQRALAEDGYEAWLRHRTVSDAQLLDDYRNAFRSIAVEGDSAVLRSAGEELHRGLAGLLGRELPTGGAGADGAIIVRAQEPTSRPALGSAAENFTIRRDAHRTEIVGESPRGALYGAFAFLRHLQLHRPLAELAHLHQSPTLPLRLVNHWDNLDGTIERGYAGRSIFRWDELPKLTDRYADYARLLASIGIHGICINNVNVGKGSNVRILTPEYLDKVAALAEPFRAYGVRIYLSAGFDAPRTLGGLETADPLDPAVRAWWNRKADEIYARIPDFGGFVVKADSEGQPGPYVYGRDHADGANMLAAALKPHGGVVMWRTFVYAMRKGADRAAMASEHFVPLDGRFADNVLVQVKNGPIDFQIREPVHPLLGTMPRSRAMLELQVTQEYTGHDVHVCYLAPAWKQVLDFDTHAAGAGSTVSRVTDGSLAERGGGHGGGITAVVNAGEDRTWLGHDLHMANLYAYGRLACDPALAADTVAEEWAKMTFGHDPLVVKTVVSILMNSADAYEAYTSPLGTGVMHEAGDHFDPLPEIRFAYHGATRQGVGIDRTVRTGSGYAGLYRSPVAKRYEAVETCPDELLLFFHHVPYTHRLRSGKTVIQHIYDAHFDGVAQVERFRDAWAKLKGKVDDERHARVLAKLDQQVRHAGLWRDRINLFFFQLSGIADEKNRVRSDYRLSPR